MTRRETIPALLLLLPLGCAYFGLEQPLEPVRQEPARLFVQSLVGQADSRLIDRSRVAVVLDATRAMRSVTDAGPTHLTSARTALERFLDGLDPETEIDLRLLGSRLGTWCESPAQPYDANDRAGLRRIGARGRGSLPRTLLALAEEAETEIMDRVVVFTRLSNGCGDDLCDAAREVARAGVRLDLVIIGEEPAPACLASIAREEFEAAPRRWRVPASIPYRVESTGPDAAVQVCSATGGLPVVVQPGWAEVEVALDPPLRIGQRFEPGSRWLLEILDFPALDPPARRWRWRELSPGPVARVEVSP